MTAISGTIRIGEAMPTADATARRQRGSVWWFWALMLVLVVGMGGLGVWLSAIADANPLVGWLIGALAGMAMYSRWSKTLSVWRFRKTQGAKGIPLDLAIRLEATPEAIVYQIGDITSRAPWRAVTDVFHEKGWWIVVVQGSAMFAADRFFASDAEKRAFLREVLSHISEDARARSPEAVKFAGEA